ncbi:hypothetical protein [Sphingomonas baiyangensis]|uniref:hypothetical protein n=1 Tax=Sphingomonas baiyangensis TaxID=2572576 RepID=UPI00201695A8|nr:hypothetical protein [Sphingomonas baiyangensis]
MAAAHRAVRGDDSIQFDFPWIAPEPDNSIPWLEAVGRAISAFFQRLGPFWEVVFWAMAALVVAMLVLSLWPPARAWLAGLRVREQADPEAAQWTPQASAARALLQEAETLAEAGRYDEAVRLLLHRSIEDIERWRSGLVHRSSTARDIAGSQALPGGARALFGRLVSLTERGLFARRPLAAADWTEARDAYRGFTL